MAASDTRKPTDPPMGVYRRPEAKPAIGAAETIGIALSLIWVLAAAAFFAFVPEDGQFTALAVVMTALAVVLPVGLIWIAVGSARSARMMSEESARLQSTLDNMRRSYIAEHQGAPSSAAPSASDRKLDELLATQRQIEGQLAELRKASGIGLAPVSSKAEDGNPAPRSAIAGTATGPQPETQPSLALGPSGEGELHPVSVEDFIRAIHFPQSETDHDGFRALKAALRDPATAALVRAAQDVLTLLSEDGIYMDDFAPDRARPEIWRRFAGGERGPAVTALGGIRDRSSLALAAGRMRNDAVFRDAAHHFLRKFDTTFTRFAESATDSEIAALSETRTARAFMLLGRVAGTFD